MHQAKKIIVFVTALWLTSFLFYYNVVSLARFSWTHPVQLENLRYSLRYHESDEFLIDTPGCSIPNYLKKLKFKGAMDYNSTCGHRAISIKKLSEDVIVFNIDEDKMVKYSDQSLQCCYRYAIRSAVPTYEDTNVTYTPCELFRQGTQVKLKHEVITVTCKVHGSKQNTVYEDAYIIVKKKSKKNDIDKNKSWNVLLLGMDTISRARAVSTMPKTVRYLQKHEWLDYRGYHKVAVNTFPNLMALLTGKNMSTVYHACSKGLYGCQDFFMWSKFKEAGFTTAYGEDYLRLPDTFSRYNGFKIPPTDHYTRPFFLTGERHIGNLICVKKKPSAVHLLDYALQFSNAYKQENFFGLFWLNSYSHNLDNIPTLLENHLIQFFEHLNNTGVLENTFVFFFSDHGIRYGEMRFPMQSYFEERLPMLYMWIPIAFRKMYKDKYSNLILNQYRLTTPYDLYVTLETLLKISNSSVDVISPQACPQCQSLFEEKTIHRKCKDAGIDDKWCSCHNLVKADRNETAANLSLQLAVAYIQNITKFVKTTDCTKCVPLNLKSVLRIHSYSDENNNKTYYVVAFVMSPGDIAYEATVENDGPDFKILQPTDTISQYNTEGSCVKTPRDRAYCICVKHKNCNKRGKTYIHFRFIIKLNTAHLI